MKESVKGVLFIILALIAWAPFFIYNKIKKIFFPQTIEKLNKSSE